MYNNSISNTIVGVLIVLLLLQCCNPTLGFHIVASSSSVRSTASRSSPSEPPSIQSLLQQARTILNTTCTTNDNTDAAFDVLAQVYQQDPHAKGLSSLMETCLELKIKSNPDSSSVHDRFGLASLLMDQERYDSAMTHLQHICNPHDNDAPPFLKERASSLLFRAKAALCDWTTRSDDDDQLVTMLQHQLDNNEVPTIHPFEALKWPCITMAQATRIAQLYGRRAVESQGLNYTAMVMMQQQKKRARSTVTLSSSTRIPRQKNKIRLGYLSPDFTPTHPMALLTQNVFGHHNRSDFEVYIFSLSADDIPSRIRDAAHKVVDLSPSQSARALSGQIASHGIDILIDLCGYTGPSLVAEIMAHRPSALQLAWMGFPGSSQAPYMDYLICDQTVVQRRQYYSESLLYMPHSYFANSHSVTNKIKDTDTVLTRSDVGLPDDAFVFCCHSRPDKLDPITVQHWADVIYELRTKHNIPAVLWLLRSCPTMEENVRAFLPDLDVNDALFFCNIAPRRIHLQRLGLSNVFLDTNAYNAHTVGCDALYAKCPIVTLLLDNDDTTKWPSRVGASLIRAAGNDDELVATSWEEYRQIMAKCALDATWFQKIQHQCTTTSPLFDTQSWVQYLDRALLYLYQEQQQQQTNAAASVDILLEANDSEASSSSQHEESTQTD